MRASLCLICLLSLCACSIGRDTRPVLTQPVQLPQRNPIYASNISQQMQGQTNPSLWRSGPQSLFGDRRAREAGDIVTVVISIDEEAEMQNSVNAQRSTDEDFSVTALLGLNALADKVFSGDSTLQPGVDVTRSSTQNGSGNISRQEKIDLRVAAVVTDILPNGHMIIAGTQQIRVNQEIRDLEVSGIIRPEDISRQNTVTYEKIAEARVAYGGRGQVSDAVSQSSGTRLLKRIIPF